jgi:hypothetical protein
VRRQENGFWFLGCKFISELSEDEMHRLLRAQLQASEAPASKLEITLPQITLPPVPTQANAVAQEEKRDEKRRIGHIHLQLEIAPHTTVGCVIANFAATRSWPLAAGAVGLLKGKDKTGQPWKLKVKVHQCRSAAEGWNLECRLVKAPSELDLLRALGGLVVKI